MGLATVKLSSHFPGNPLWFSGFLGSLQDSELPTNPFWFGLSLNRQDGTWRWSSINHAISWDDWAIGQPSTAYAENSGCLAFSVFIWYGCYGTDSRSYMCEMMTISTEQRLIMPEDGYQNKIVNKHIRGTLVSWGPCQYKVGELLKYVFHGLVNARIVCPWSEICIVINVRN